MNNVSQKVHSSFNIQKEGTGTVAVVLSFCALFFVSQIYLIFNSSNIIIPIEEQLKVTPDHNLSVAIFDSSKKQSNSNEPNPLESPDSYHFAPFFFRPIPINYSDKSLLMSVKGIGPSLAERILQARSDKGFFTSSDDLLDIKGIGSSRLLKLKPYLSFSIDHAQ